MTEPTDVGCDRAVALVLAKWPGSGTSSIEVRACALGLESREAEVKALLTQVEHLKSVGRELGADVADLESCPPDLTIGGDLTITTGADRVKALETALRESCEAWGRLYESVGQKGGRKLNGWKAVLLGKVD